MKFSQMTVGTKYEGPKGATREIVAINKKTNEITYREGGMSTKMPGQEFAKWAVSPYRDPSTRKQKEDRPSA